MKKTMLVIVLALSAAALFAQKAVPEPVTVTGNLALVNGRIAVQSGDDVYYVTGIQRLIGFVDGLKEGAQVSLEGYVRNLPRADAKVLRASKLTVAGKSYDLAPAGIARFSGNPPERNSQDKPRYANPGFRRNASPYCCWGFTGGRSFNDRGRPEGQRERGAPDRRTPDRPQRRP